MRNYIAKKLINLGYRLSPDIQNLARIIPEAGADDREILATGSRYSMTQPVAQWALIQAVTHAQRQGVAGDIVECGVWKGGNLIIAGLVCKRLSSDRTIWGYDTFEGMTAPTEFDSKLGLDAARKFAQRLKDTHVDWCYAPIDEVERNCRAHVGNYPIKLVKGPVESTLRNESNIPKEISVLRLDTDFYESTKVELEVLYPRLSPGGVLIVDDYGEWAGARKAVDEFFANSGAWLHYVDKSVRLIIKP